MGDQSNWGVWGALVLTPQQVMAHFGDLRGEVTVTHAYFTVLAYIGYSPINMVIQKCP